MCLISINHLIKSKRINLFIGEVFQVKPYKTSFVGMLVPIGSHSGVGNINGINLPGNVFHLRAA